jgi:hypothetical protein
VLSETATKGIYSTAAVIALDDPKLTAWLVEASLRAAGTDSAPLKELLDNPSLFPFRMKPMSGSSLVVSSSQLEILRHGIDEELVILRK